MSEKKRKVSTQESVTRTSEDTGSACSQVSQEGSRRSFEKIINQNQKILQKLDALLSSQKTLEERMIKLEKVPDGNNEELIKVTNIINKMIEKIVKKVKYLLIIHKMFDV
jgi:hypothetical protein